MPYPPNIIPLHQAWGILGKDATGLIRAVMARPTLEERIGAINTILMRAKKLARRMAAQCHPDINPNDPTATSRFMEIQTAINSIEFHTEEFKTKALQVQQEKCKSKTDPIILVE